MPGPGGSSSAACGKIVGGVAAIGGVGRENDGVLASPKAWKGIAAGLAGFRRGEWPRGRPAAPRARPEACVRYGRPRARRRMISRLAHSGWTSAYMPPERGQVTSNACGACGGRFQPRRAAREGGAGAGEWTNGGPGAAPTETKKARRASSGKTGGVKPFGAPAAGLPQEVKNLTPAETAEYLRNRIDAPAANTEGDTPEEKVIRRTTRRWLRRRAEKASFLSTRSS